MDGALEVPACWQLTATVYVGSMHDRKQSLVVVAKLRFEGRKKEVVKLRAIFFSEGCTGKDISELGVKVDWSNVCGLCSVECGGSESSHDGTKGCSSKQKLVSCGAARGGPKAESTK